MNKEPQGDYLENYPSGNQQNGTVLTQPMSSGNTLNLRSLFFRVLRNWYWVVLGLAVGYLVGQLRLRYAIPVYKVQASLFIRENEAARSGGISQEQIVEEFGFETNSSIENEIQLLKSRALMLNVVDSLQLNVRYFLEGRVKTTESYSGDAPVRLVEYLAPEETYATSLRVLTLTKSDFGIVIGEGDTLKVTSGVPFQLGERQFLIEGTGTKSSYPILIRVARPEGAAAAFAGKLNISTVGRSDVLRLNLQDEVPARSVDIINVLVHVYNKSIVDDKNRSGENTLAFINERLQFVTNELFNIEENVEEFRRESNIPLDLSEKASRYLEQIGAVDQQLMELNLQLILLDQLENTLEQDTTELQPLPVVSEVISTVLSSLITEYNTVLLERDRLATSATAENPVLRQYEAQLKELGANILLGLATIRRELNTKIDQLEDRLTPLQGQVNTIPANERKLLQIMREQQIRETLFLFLLQRREETALALAAQTSNARLIDPASVGGPVSPNRSQILLYSVFLGLALPLGVITAREYFDNKVRSEKDIREITSVPLLGAVTYSRQNQEIVVKSDSRSSIAEGMRLLRTNLQFQLTGKKPLILVTSATSGEGKTFITINLGMTYALSGKRTLLIGLDLRKPKLGRYLNASDTAVGISSYLVGEASLEEVVRPTEAHANLFFIPSGPIPPNPAELIMGAGLKELMEQLDDQFDCILLDTAPVGLVTDAILLRDYANASLFVTYFGKTKKSAIQLLDKLYQEQKLPRLATLINGVRTGSGYGYSYLYGYQHGYADYSYYREEAKRPWYKVW